MAREVIKFEGIIEQELDETAKLFLSPTYRKRVLGDIAMWENRERKREAFKQFEVFHDRSRVYVDEYLRSQFSETTVSTMPKVDTMNISKRIVQKQASLYNENPKREFKGLSEEQQSQVEAWYVENGVNEKLFSANNYYKLQDQATLWVVPVGKQLKTRCLLPHQFDVIPKSEDPEQAAAYIVNNFDRSWFYRATEKGQDGYDALIADYDDYKLENMKFLVWTEKCNFIINAKGKFVSPIKKNETEELPFIDIAKGKDLEFFVRGGRALTDFTIQFNGVLSDLYNVVKMQGWAVGYLKAPSTMMPENLVVGPNMLLKLPIDPNNPESSAGTEFGYASPNADIAGSISFLETLISLYLTSKGLDAKAISMKLDSVEFNSGLDRLLAMLDVFEASKSDMEKFQKAERKLFKLISKWSNAMRGDEEMKDNMLPFAVPEAAELLINFTAPEMVTTEKEKLEIIEKRLDMKLITYVEAIALDRNIDETLAEEIAEEIQSADIELKKKQMDALTAAGLNENPEGDEADGKNGDVTNADNKAKPDDKQS